MGIKECCSTMFAGLPDPSLPLLPSMALGLFFAALILLFFYKKQNKLPLKVALIDLVRQVFCLFPSPDHAESQECKNPSCIRCCKYKELELQIVSRWKALEQKDRGVSKRLEDAVALVSRRANKDDNKDQKAPKAAGKNGRTMLQSPTIFGMDLAANPYWNEFQVYNVELGLLQLNFEIIQKEFQLIFEAMKSGDHWGWKKNDLQQGHWCIFPFIDQGVINESNCRRCPNTSTMIGTLPSVMKDCVFGNACFSVLYPNSHIQPHCGPTNLRLRCHLGLQVPGGSYLEVNGTQYKWKAGETVVFDDSFEHSAVFSEQPSGAQSFPRAILMVDFWHPDVTQQEKKLLLELLAP